MAELTDAEIEAANARGRELAQSEPRARAARYDAASDRVIVELTNGASFAFPPWLGQGLRGASPEDLAEVRPSPGGYGLHWERLDTDLAVPELMRGVFGTRAWMEGLGVREAAE